VKGARTPTPVTPLPPLSIGDRVRRAPAFLKQLWSAMGEDDAMFLASGIAFNLLLAVVPFVLLLVSVSVLALGSTPDSAADTAMGFLDRLLPARDWTEGDHVREAVRDVARVGKSVTIYSAIGFLWFSTRVFGAMRSVFTKAFDVERERGIVHGKLFDIACALVAAAAVIMYTSLSVYMLAATTRGISLLTHLGVRESVMGTVEYAIGRGVTFLLVFGLCYAAYQWLPNRPIPPHTAFIGSTTTSLLFEVARTFFGSYVRTFAPSSFYTGALATLVIVTLWTYYAALIFIIGAEVAQVVELRRRARRTAANSP
jgi:membrane protein